MDAKTIDNQLVEKGYGILSLCYEGRPYSIPISFGYDGESIFFGFLVDSPNSKKVDYIGEEKIVRLLVTEIRGRFNWQSIAVTGPVKRVDSSGDQWEHLLNTLEDNGWFMKAFQRSNAIDSIHGWELQIEEIKGIERKEGNYE